MTCDLRACAQRSILRVKSEELTKGLSQYHARKPEAEAMVRSGTVERRPGEKRTIAAKWIEFVMQMSEATVGAAAPRCIKAGLAK